MSHHKRSHPPTRHNYKIKSLTHKNAHHSHDLFAILSSRGDDVSIQPPTISISKPGAQNSMNSQSMGRNKSVFSHPPANSTNSLANNSSPIMTSPTHRITQNLQVQHPSALHNTINLVVGNTQPQLKLQHDDDIDDNEYDQASVDTHTHRMTSFKRRKRLNYDIFSSSMTRLSFRPKFQLTAIPSHLRKGETFSQHLRPHPNTAIDSDDERNPHPSHIHSKLGELTDDEGGGFYTSIDEFTGFKAISEAVIDVNIEELLPSKAELHVHTPQWTPSTTKPSTPPRAKLHPALQAQLKQQEESDTHGKRRKFKGDYEVSDSEVSRPSKHPITLPETHDIHLVLSTQPYQDSTSQFPTPHSTSAQFPYVPHSRPQDVFDINGPLPGACSIEEAMDCVIKIFVTQILPNFLQPWQTRPSSDHMGSGFVVKGKRIITNAHVVADAFMVMVRRPGSSRKHVARVVASAHECDLAMLEVDDESFWAHTSSINLETGAVERHPGDGTVFDEDYGDEKSRVAKYKKYNDPPALPGSNLPVLPIPNTLTKPTIHGLGPGSMGAPWWSLIAPEMPEAQVGAPRCLDQYGLNHTTFQRESGSLYISPFMPTLQSSVVVVGYPLGGDNVCITQGVVSRIEPTTYAHTGTYLLSIQIDASINPGNSGGPALTPDGRVIGVAFQNITNASNIGYIIPAPVIIHFLRDVQRGAYRVKKLPTVKQITSPTHSLLGGGDPREAQKRYLLHPYFKQMQLRELPRTKPDSDQRWFAPYLSGFPTIGLFCQDTSSDSLRDYIGLSSVTKLVNISEKDNELDKPRHIAQGIEPLDAMVELKTQAITRHRSSRSNAQYRRFPDPHDQIKKEQLPNEFTLYQYNTNQVPAAFQHYQAMYENYHADLSPHPHENALSLENNANGAINTNKKLPLEQLMRKNTKFRKEMVSGVLINEVSALSPFAKFIRPGDVLLAVDGHELGSDGSVHFRCHERIAFDHIIALKHQNQIIELTILRKHTKSPEQLIEAHIPGISEYVQKITSQADKQHNLGYTYNVYDYSGKDDEDNEEIINLHKKIIDGERNKSNNSNDDDSDIDPSNYHSHHDEGLQFANKHLDEKQNIKHSHKHSTKLKNLKHKQQFKHRIAAPCDCCSHEIESPVYNASFYQDVYDFAEKDPRSTEESDKTDSSSIFSDGDLHTAVKKRKNIDNALKTHPSRWNTVLSIVAKFVHHKQTDIHAQHMSHEITSKATQKRLKNTDNTSSTRSTQTGAAQPAPALNLTPIPNSITHPSSHFSRLPLDYDPNAADPTTAATKLEKHHNYAINKPEYTHQHTLCVANDFEIATIRAPVTILPSTSPNVYDRGASYVFFGGLLFVPLSYQYIKDVGSDVPLHLTLARCAPLKTPDEQKIVLAQVLQDSETIGYPYLDRPITHVCGVPVRNMSGLLEVIQTKVLCVAISQFIKDYLMSSQNPAVESDPLLLLHMLRTNNCQIDYDVEPIRITSPNGEKYIHSVNYEEEAQCRVIYQILTALSDILCSETDLDTYSTSLLYIYCNLPDTAWKRYLTQVVDMYIRPNPQILTPREVGTAGSYPDRIIPPTAESLSQQPMVFQAKKAHHAPSKQAIMALFDYDITTLPLHAFISTQQQPGTSNHEQKQQTQKQRNQTNNHNQDKVKMFPFKQHAFTVQTAENKLVALDMDRAIGAHYRLKETLNI